MKSSAVWEHYWLPPGIGECACAVLGGAAEADCAGLGSVGIVATGDENAEGGMLDEVVVCERDLGIQKRLRNTKAH